jgi:hypothetical protein
MLKDPAEILNFLLDLDPPIVLADVSVSVIHAQLAPYITICNESTSSLLRVGTYSWITYVSDSNSTGYIIRPVCPFDCCQPETENIIVNLNVSGGANAIICAHNRRGVLCGACQPSL